MSERKVLEKFDVSRMWPLAHGWQDNDDEGAAMTYGRHIHIKGVGHYTHMASMPIPTSPVAQVYRWRWLDRLLLGRRCPVCHVRLRHRGHDERHAAVVAGVPGPHLHFEILRPGYIKAPDGWVERYGQDVLDEVNRGEERS